MCVLYNMSDMEELDRKYMSKPNGRVLRNRRYKRPFDDTRSDKRLFTPEIKRHLKTWLIRRRDNPYPSREEKKQLAVQTGLTYIQICNWFANWRRKLKNAGRNIDKFTWSTIIKSYNNQIIGNLEHLSISSDDSIWEEADLDNAKDHLIISQTPDHSYTSLHNYKPSVSSYHTQLNEMQYQDGHQSQSKTVCSPISEQCFQISSTTDFIQTPTKKDACGQFPQNLTKPNRQCMEKRKTNVRDDNCNYDELLASEDVLQFGKSKVEGTNAILLSKWRRSAACFRPSCKSYLFSGSDPTKKNVRNNAISKDTCHDREELDAAEALTTLSRTSYSKLK